MLHVRILLLTMRIPKLNTAEPELGSALAVSSQTPASPQPCPSLPGAKTCSEPFDAACSWASSPLRAPMTGKAPKLHGRTSVVPDPLLQHQNPTLAPRLGTELHQGDGTASTVSPRCDTSLPHSHPPTLPYLGREPGADLGLRELSGEFRAVICRLPQAEGSELVA